MGNILHGFFLSLIVLSLVAVIVFVLVEALPGDAATAYLGQQATPEGLAQVRLRLGLDRPAHERFFEWAGGILRGDLGVSLSQDELSNLLLSLNSCTNSPLNC